MQNRGFFPHHERSDGVPMSNSKSQQAAGAQAERHEIFFKGLEATTEKLYKKIQASWLILFLASIDTYFK